MRLSIALVDAFAERAFAGNPAGVIVLDAPLPEATMQAVATELAQPETAFLVPSAGGGGGWDLRWFSPAQEVSFCGHATLAAAHVLAEEGRAGDLLAFRTLAGVLRVGVEAGGRYALDLPRRDPEPGDLADLPLAVEGACGVFREGDNLYVELASEGDLRAYVPDFGAIAAALGPTGLCLTAPGEDADMASRYFWPAGGIPEDAVTGSIHATLVPFWAARLGRDRLSAVQASRRGGRIEAHLTPDRVILTGGAVTTLRGHIDLPDRGPD